MRGNLKQIDSGPTGIVWGVNRYDKVFCRLGIRLVINSLVYCPSCCTAKNSIKEHPFCHDHPEKGLKA